MLRASSLLVLALWTFAGCSGLDQVAERDLELAADVLHEQFDEPGLIAATAVLYHAQHESYPTDRFALLGSAAARETGLQTLGLSALDLSPSDEDLTIRYTLLPTVSDSSERYGTLIVAEADAANEYEVRLVLERRTDPDLRDQRLPLAHEGIYRVMRADGTLCAELDAVRARGRDAGSLPLDDGTTYTVTFRPSEGAPSVGALRDGVTVTLPR